MSMKEWVAALNGYMESKGISKADAPVTREDLDDLMEKYPDVRKTT